MIHLKHGRPEKNLIAKTACEVNEKGTREKIDGNEASSMSNNEKKTR